MSEDMKIESKNKLNKKLLTDIAIFSALVVVIAFSVFVPKTAEAKRIEKQLNLGEKYLTELNYEQAEAAYLAVIEIDPRNVNAYIGLAEVYIAQGEYEKAEVILEDVLEVLGGDEAEIVREKLDEIYAVKLATEITPTPEPTATSTPVPTLEPIAMNTPMPTPTNEPTPEPTSTPTPEPTSTPTPEPTPEPTSTPTPEPTSTPTPEPTNTPKPTNTPTPEPTNTPKPTNTPTPKPTSTPTPRPTPQLVLIEIQVRNMDGISLENAEVILTDEKGVFHKADRYNGDTYVISVQEGDYNLNISAHGYKSIQDTLRATEGVIYREHTMESEYMSQDYGEIAGHRYQFFEAGTMEWEEVEELCRLMGGHLAVISSKVENDFLYQMLRDNGYRNAYFGYSDREEEGNWKWLNGESSYENWAKGEPNNTSGGEDYAMFYYQFEDGTWNDGNFGHGTLNDDKIYICEWDSLE